MGCFVAFHRRRSDRGLLFWAGHDLPGGTSVDEFLQHMLPLGNFVSSATTDWSNPSARSTARRPGYTDVALRRGGTAPPLPRVPGRDFVASLRLVSSTLGCPPQEDPHHEGPYQDRPPLCPFRL